MKKLKIEELDITNIQNVKEYSDLIMETMNEFNKPEMSDFQIWFASPEQIIERKKSSIMGGDQNDTVQFIIRYNSKIIGVLEIEDKNHIQSFFVKKEFHRKGIGKMLFNYAIKYFIEKGYRITYLSVLSSDYAIDFYKKLGFKGREKWMTLFFENKYYYLFFIYLHMLINRFVYIIINMLVSLIFTNNKLNINRSYDVGGCYENRSF